MKKLIYIVSLQLILTLNYCNSQWYHVNLPISSGIRRVQFVNQNTGWIMTYNCNILKSTNSGLNWLVATDSTSRIFDFQFINDTLGYGMGTNGSGANLILKTNNGGYNWIIMQSSYQDMLGGFFVLNADTGWVNSFTFPTQSTYMTTDGFQTLNLITSGVGGNPAIMYFFKEPYNGGLCGYINNGYNLWRTTNSGFNWTQLIIPSAYTYQGFSFINKDTGWVIADFQNSKIYKTTNGGVNWNSQFQIQNSNSLSYIFAVNSDKIWCGVNQNYLLVSTNGGTNWGKQYTPMYSNGGVYMYDTLLGFAWAGSQLVRTTNGGGAIIGINQISTEVPEEYSLGQNYPNPFNPSTTIEFSLPKESYVKLKILDLSGKTVFWVVYDMLLRSGLHKFKIVEFEKLNLSSGVYFYQMEARDINTGKLNFTQSRKMILLK